jgi:hypothetical protein
MTMVTAIRKGVLVQQARFRRVHLPFSQVFSAA